MQGGRRQARIRLTGPDRVERTQTDSDCDVGVDRRGPRLGWQTPLAIPPQGLCRREHRDPARLEVSGQTCTVKVQWHNPTLDNKQGGLVLADGRIYGYAEAGSRGRPWVSIDFKTGSDIFRSAPLRSSYKYPNGSLTYADGMFYLYSDDGKVALARATDRGFVVTGRLRVENPGRNPTWAHPVVCGGRLYLRYGDKLAAYDVAARR